MSHSTSLTSSEAAKPVSHLAYLDSIRGLAALYVVIHHALIYFWPPWGAQPNNSIIRLANEFFFYGRYAVALFIVLSGYCLALPMITAGGRMRHSFTDYIKRRARRILPPYYFALLLSLGFIALTGTAPTNTIWDDSIKLTPAGIASHLFVVQHWFGHWHFGQINYVFWSVAVEWHIYFLFPAIVVLWSRLTPVLATLLVATVTLTASWVLRTSPLSHLNLQFVGLFALGMLAAQLAAPAYAAKLIKPAALAIALLAFAATVALSAHFGWMRLVHLWPLLDLCVGLSACGLLIYLGHAPSHPLRHLLNLRPLVFLGGFSYSLYLLHAPILHATWLLGAKTLQLTFLPSLAFMLAVGLPTCLALSYLFHLCCERPFMNTKPTPPPKISVH